MGLSTSILRRPLLSLPYHLSPSLTQTSLILPHPGSVHSSCSSSCTWPSHSFSVPIPQCPLTADFRSALWKLAFNLGTCQGTSFLSCQETKGPL